MDFGVVLQNDPPAAGVVELAKQAEAAGFSHVWTFDSHVLWQEPFVIYSQILADTQQVIVGPMVTNPGTRDWTVTASLFATLNEMYGNRTVCGIGRGDSAVRVLHGAPDHAGQLRECVAGDPGAGQRARRCEYDGATLQFPWAPDSRLEVWVAAYGPKALALTGEVGDGFILQLADPDIAAWMIEAVRDAAEAGGPRPGRHQVLRRRPGLRRRRPGPPAGPDAGGSAAWSATTSPTSSPATAPTARCPTALTDYIKGRQGYDYAEHGRAGNTHTDFVPDEIVDRFCLLGPVEHHLKRLAELQALGVDQFAVYLQHDAKDADAAPPTASTSSAGAPSAVDREALMRLRLAPGADVRGRRARPARRCSGRATRRFGHPRRHTCFGVRVLPRADDLSMPHLWDVLQPLRPARADGGRPAHRRVRAGGRPVHLPASPLVGFVAGVAVGLALAVADAAVPDRRARPAAVRGPVPDRAAGRAGAAGRRLGRAADALRLDRGRTGCRSR